MYTSWSDPKAPFFIVITLKCWEGPNSFPCIAPLTLDPYIIMLSVNQGVFVMTRPGIELQSSGPLANTLPTTPVGRSYIYSLNTELIQHFATQDHLCP